eukprot:scaffold65678_cov49-Prasinocladus_malaysianus.AAC.1
MGKVELTQADFEKSLSEVRKPASSQTCTTIGAYGVMSLMLSSSPFCSHHFDVALTNSRHV